MNFRTSLLVISVLVLSMGEACQLSAREKSDIIVMKNGDKITCEVKALSSNTLFISVDYILNTLPNLNSLGEPVSAHQHNARLSTGIVFRFGGY